MTSNVRTLRNLWPDLLAGISVAGFILPEAVAYAGIANSPPIMGIVAAVVGLLVYGIIGKSRFALVAATSSSAAVLVAALRSLQPIDVQHSFALASGLVMFTGLIFCLCRLLHLGRIAQFIARPVVRGLALGLAIVIVMRQLAKITVIHTQQTDVFPLAYELIRNLPQWNLYGVAFGALTLLILFGLKRWPTIPGPLVVIVLGIAATTWFDLSAAGISVVGPISLSRIEMSIPQLSANEWLRTAELSVALMLILFAESYGSIRAVALKHGDSVDVNRDLLALGVANLVSGLLHAMPVGAGYSASSANEAIGARSRLSGLSAAVYVLFAVWLLIHYIERIPEPVLAAIVVFAMQHALNFDAIRPYLLWKRDRTIVATTIVAVLLLGVLDGLLAAVAFSLVLLIRGLSQPRVSVLGHLGISHDYVAINSHPQAQALPGMLILRPEEPLFFANVEAVLDNACDLLQHAHAVQTLILSLEESPDIDGTVIEALDQFASKIHAQGQRLVLARVKDPVYTVLTEAKLNGLQSIAISPASVAAAVETAGHFDTPT